MMPSTLIAVALVAPKRGPRASPTRATGPSCSMRAAAPRVDRGPQRATDGPLRRVLGALAAAAFAAKALERGGRNLQKRLMSSRNTAASPGQEDMLWAEREADATFKQRDEQSDAVGGGKGPGAPRGPPFGGDGGPGKPPRNSHHVAPPPGPRLGITTLFLLVCCVAIVLALLCAVVDSVAKEGPSVAPLKWSSSLPQEFVAQSRSATIRRPSTSAGLGRAEMALLALLLCCYTSPWLLQHLRSVCEALHGNAADDARRAAAEEEWRQLVVPRKYRRYMWPQVWTQCVPPITADWARDVPAAFARVIEVDLPRTFAGTLDADERDTLARVLGAYARHNPAVGYTQGMSFIAGVFLLLHFNEAEAFMGMKFIVEEVCVGYHGPHLEGYFRDLALLEAMVPAMLPDVHTEMVSLGIPLHRLATDHFISVGARNWPLFPVVRLWDALHRDGRPALLASFLALLQMYFHAALEACRAEGLQRAEMAPYAGQRFIQISNARVSRDVNDLMLYTARFTLRVREWEA